MKQIAMLLFASLTTLFFSGCCDKSIEIVRPKTHTVIEANITQCRGKDEVNLTKCVLTNYFEVKQERDSLRAIVEGMK